MCVFERCYGKHVKKVKYRSQLEKRTLQMKVKKESKRSRTNVKPKSNKTATYKTQTRKTQVKVTKNVKQANIRKQPKTIKNQEH